MPNQIHYRKAAEFCKENYPETAEKILSVANDVLENRFLFDMPWDMERTEEAVQFKEQVDWFYMLNHDQEFLYQLNRHIYFIWLAQSYYLTDNTAYLEKLSALWTDFLERVPQKSGQQTPYRSLEVGMRAGNWLKALAMLEGTPYLTAEFKEKIDSALKEHVRILKETHEAFQVGSNWGVIQDCGLFLLGAYFHDDEIKDLAFHRLDEETSLQIMADGVHWEQSSGYHNAVLFTLLDVYAAAKQIGYPLPDAFVKRLERMAEVNVKWLKPNRHHPLLGDSDDNDVRDVLSRCALLFGRGDFKALGFSHLDWDSAFLFGEAGIERYDALSAKMPDYLSTALPDSGQCIYRTSWAEDADWLQFVNGKVGGGHGHADKGHISLCLDGRDVLVDGGRYTYKSTNERRYLKSAAAHNTSYLAKKPFLQPLDAWTVCHAARSLPNTFTETNDYVLIEGGHLGYLSSKLYCQRSVLILKPNIYIFLDSFFAKGLHSYVQHYHFAPGGELKCTPHLLRYTDAKGTVYLHLVYEKGKVSPASSLYSANYNAVLQNPAAKIRFRACDFASTAAVLIKGEDEKTNPAKVYAVPAKKLASGRALPKKDAEGLVIEFENNVYTVCLAHEEVRDVFSCNGKKAFGRITVYKNDAFLFSKG